MYKWCHMVFVFLLLTYFTWCHIHAAANGHLRTCPQWYPSQEYKAYQPIRFRAAMLLISSLPGENSHQADMPGMLKDQAIDPLETNPRGRARWETEFAWWGWNKGRGMSEKMLMVVAPDSLGQSWEARSVLQNRSRQALPLPTVFLIRTFSVYINADSPFITVS